MLRTRVQCRAVLAITATATASTAAAVARVLDIAPDGIIRDDSVRANLRLSVAHTNGGAQPSLRRPCLPVPEPRCACRSQPYHARAEQLLFCETQAHP